MEKEKKEADFLKKYYKYQTNKEGEKSPQDSTENGIGLDEDEKDNGQANIYEEDDWPVQVSFFLLLYRIWKSSSNFFLPFFSISCFLLVKLSLFCAFINLFSSISLKPNNNGFTWC